MSGAGPEHERPIPKMRCPAAAPHAQMRQKAPLKRRLSYLLKGPSGYRVRAMMGSRAVLVVNPSRLRQASISSTAAPPKPSSTILRRARRRSAYCGSWAFPHLVRLRLRPRLRVRVRVGVRGQAHTGSGSGSGARGRGLRVRARVGGRVEIGFRTGDGWGKG